MGGASEPVYLPGNAHSLAQVVYTQDYFRSALHEIAHWCVAGPARQQLIDYGYWYAPDGRTAMQQSEFERVEVYPQALELIFCAACAHSFRVSLDNLSGEACDSRPFELAVRERARQLLATELNERAQGWAQALAREYRGVSLLQPAWLEEVFISWTTPSAPAR